MCSTNHRQNTEIQNVSSLKKKKKKKNQKEWVEARRQKQCDTKMYLKNGHSMSPTGGAEVL
jgi:hypothetical protein